MLVFSSFDTEILLLYRYYSSIDWITHSGGLPVDSWVDWEIVGSVGVVELEGAGVGVVWGGTMDGYLFSIVI